MKTEKEPTKIKNGKYITRHRLTGKKRYTNFHNGIAHYKDEMGYSKLEKQEQFLQHNEIVKPLGSHKARFDLVLVSGGIVREKVIQGASYAVCQWKKNQMGKGKGLYQIRRTEA